MSNQLASRRAAFKVLHCAADIIQLLLARRLDLHAFI